MGELLEKALRNTYGFSLDGSLGGASELYVGRGDQVSKHEVLRFTTHSSLTVHSLFKK